MGKLSIIIRRGTCSRSDWENNDWESAALTLDGAGGEGCTVRAAVTGSGTGPVETAPVTSSTPAARVLPEAAACHSDRSSQVIVNEQAVGTPLAIENFLATATATETGPAFRTSVTTGTTENRVLPEAASRTLDRISRSGRLSTPVIFEKRVNIAGNEIKAGEKISVTTSALASRVLPPEPLRTAISRGRDSAAETTSENVNGTTVSSVQVEDNKTSSVNTATAVKAATRESGETFDRNYRVEEKIRSSLIPNSPDRRKSELSRNFETLGYRKSRQVRVGVGSIKYSFLGFFTLGRRTVLQNLSRSGSLRRNWSFFLGLLVMILLCDKVIGVPAPQYENFGSSLAKNDWFNSLPNDLAYEDPLDEEDYRPVDRLGEDELEIIRSSIMQGLGLRRLPDPAKANVSQAEYERAHKEYLRRLELSHHAQESTKQRKLHIFRATDPPEDVRNFSRSRDVYSLYFPIEIPEEDASVEHASLRLYLDGHPEVLRSLEILLYLSSNGDSRKLLHRRRIQPELARNPRWIELDSTEAVSWWHEVGLDNAGLELEILHDDEPIARGISEAVMNVFTRQEANSRQRRAAPDQLMSLHKGRRTECKGDNKKCCRHEMNVIFKDLKGFEFIIQPKTFDAGYCKGRCPPRYNPAHHHALLQSLIWKEDRRKAPRPCCAPSKLAELEILYFDENDPTKLKVSNWKNMKVLECACS
ncbi:bone morphogenetic protein 4 [Prorops nasuta]|uniref:bone morphogenetic protein 4 n=1 Tax=Prorops nasuta TaxID=863751 RepID=UPI0034CD7CF1